MDDPAVSLGDKQFGSAAALPIFANTMKDIYTLGEFQIGDEPVLLSDRTDWTSPQGIVTTEICKDTYEKATRFCPNKMKEIFLSHNRPRLQCQQHSSPFSRFQNK
jgi:penicillin-binding protein 1A